MRWRGGALEPMPDRYTRIPPFAQYVGTYLIIVILMFAVLMPVSDRARQAAMQNYLNMRRYALETSAKALERQLDSFRRIPLTMRHSSYYLEMRLLDRESLQIRHYYALARLQNLYRLQCNQLELPVNGFLLFLRNDTVVADERYYYEALDCFTKYLRYEDMGAGQLLALCKEIAGQQTFLPMQAVSVDNGPGTPYLTYLYQNQEESAVYGMLLPEEALSSLFQLTDLPAGSDFVLETLEGKALYDANPSAQAGARQDLVVLRVDIPTARCRVVLSIPRSYFEDMIRPVTSLNALYATGAIAVGILLSLLFSLVNMQPLRKLLRITAPESGDGRVKNEYHALWQNIRRSMTENERLRQQIGDNKELLRVNLFTRLLAQDSYTHAEAELAADYLPMLAGPCRLLCLKLSLDEKDQTNADFVSYRMLEALTQLTGQAGFPAQISLTQFVVLLEDSQHLLPWLSEMTRTLNERISRYGASVGAGLSDAFSSLEKLHSAWLHAQFCMRYVDEQALSVFAPSLPEAARGASFQFMDLHRFHNAVLSGDLDSAQHLLDAMMETVRQRFERGEDALWLPNAALFVLDSLREDMSLPLAAHETRAALQTQSFSAIAEDLQARTGAVAQALERKKETYSSDFSMRILAYIRQHYGDASLSTESIAERFGVSKSYLYRIMKETVGMTLSDKLEEIRMEHASELLRTTERSVGDVAAACGYNSANTFYKAYKKRYGIPPNAAREG